MMRTLTRYSVACFEILLLISLSISFAYLLGEADTNNRITPVPESRQIGAAILASFGSLIFDTLASVSALEAKDAQQGMQTCLTSKNGKSCQEYLASECAAQCTSSCIPTSRKNVAACKPGTCYDTKEGTCQAGSPQSTCTAGGGQWFDEPYENIPQCREGCCLIAGGARFITEQQCLRQAAFIGAPKEFRAGIRNELQCIALASVQEEGACVFVKEFERSCRFVAKAQCQQLKGDFYPRLLCSNIELNTTCRAQETTACGTALDGTQKVYWYDSCGNKENIYDYNRRVELQKLGMLLPVNESCRVDARGNPVANARLCGNCNYLLGSACGTATEQEKAAIGNSVCRDLSCIDEQGKKRAHGESWCMYQGAIGVDTARNRGKDTPGSRHFRKVCIKGEIRNEPCADYRTEICVETKGAVEGGTFSSAACKINLAYQCFDYNGLINNEANRGLSREVLQIKEKERNQKCEQNPDCFVKHVQVGGDFAFDYCVPRYKLGFASVERGDVVCSQASVSCTAVYVKGIGGWKCKGNCDCAKAVFTEQLNDFCMSLGDCGGQVNYEGGYSQNYRVASTQGDAPKAGQTYTTELIKYAETVKGAFIEAPDVEQFYSFLGVPPGLGQASEPGDPASAFNGAGTIAGAMGTVLLAAAKTSLGFQALSSVSLASKVLVYTKGTGAGAGWAAKPMLNAYGGALAGAAIGFAATSLLLKYTGVGRGLPAALTYLLLAAGTIGGAIVGASLAVSAGASSSGFIGGLASAGPYGWVILAVVVVFTLVLKLFGIGKMRKVTYSFTCNSWQAPTGGDACKKCGQDKTPCTPYACSSLGQACQLINRETENPECISVAHNDTSPPIITFDASSLPAGNYTIEKYELGVAIKNKASNDGCIQETFATLPLRISLNEQAQCAASNESGINFGDMGEDFSSITKNRYATNHTRLHIIPSLESLGFEDWNPDATARESVFVKCKDAAGNTNARDFAIQYCVKQGPDRTPAAIIGHDPALETVGFGVTNTSVNIYTSEPATCRWSVDDREYEAMNGEMICEDSIGERTLRGWRCSARVPVTGTTTTYYVRCLDQPWLNESRQSERNANTKSYHFDLKQSATALQIDSVTPQGILSFGTEPASLIVALKTSGGVEGKTQCQFSWQNGSWIDFSDGWGTSSQQQAFQTVFSGTYELPIRCEDIAGNTATATTRFTVQIDNQPPQVTRVYREGKDIVIITDETSQCVARTTAPERGESGCAYAWANGTSMGVAGVKHRIAWNAGATYYIKCKDRFERNPGTSCTLEVKNVGADEAQHY